MTHDDAITFPTYGGCYNWVSGIVHNHLAGKLDYTIANYEIVSADRKVA